MHALYAEHHAGSMMTQDCLPHAPDSEHGKLAPCMERVLKLTGVLPACFQVNQVKKPFSGVPHTVFNRLLHLFLYRDLSAV